MIKSGDVVKVKGEVDSPKMTVGALYLKLNRAECIWFVGDSLQRDVFHPDMLEVV